MSTILAMRESDRAVGRIAALVTAAGAAVALMCIAWPIEGTQPRVYRGETWFVATLMGVAAGAAATSRRWSRAALAVAGACALQLIGTGVVAHRRWFTSVGFGVGFPAENLDVLRTMAVLLSVVATVAALGTLLALWVTRDDEFAWWRCAIGAAVAVIAPLAMGWETGNRTTQLGAHGLMYGAWGVALGAAALIPPTQRFLVDAALVACGVATVLSGPMIPAMRTSTGVAVLVAGVVAATAADHAGRVASRRSSALSAVGGANP